MIPSQAARSQPLRGWRVLVTRPAHQAGALCRLIEEAGGEAGRLPLLGIEPSSEAAQLPDRLRAGSDCAGWLFTSANAVAPLRGLALERLPTCYAVGAATAAALAELGVPAVSPQGDHSAEALLALPALLMVKGERFLVLTGEGGPDLLQRSLLERGATVETLYVYRRRPLRYDEARVEAEIAMADVIVVTSGEGLARLWELTPENLRPILRKRRLVLPSPRVVENARQQYGFEDLRVPQPMSDAGILECLAQWRHSPSDASMNETPTEATERPPPPPPAAAAITHPKPSSPAPAASRGGPVLPVLALLLAGLLGFGGWRWWLEREAQLSRMQAQEAALLQLRQEARELQSQAAQLSTRQSDLGRISQRSNLDLAALRERFEQSDQMLGRISEELLGGRARFQLAVVEQLLLEAADRLQLEGDVPTAIAATEIADRRIAALGEPRLFRVREALAIERAALLAVPRVDITAAALSLSSLISRAPQLPLLSEVRERPTRDAPQSAAAADGDGWQSRLWSASMAALRSVFVIRRDDQARILRMLPPEQQAAAYEILLLRLESARLALLKRDTAAFHAALQSADAWLGEHFAQDDPGVLAASGELARLSSLDLRPALPPFGASIEQLRAALSVDHP